MSDSGAPFTSLDESQAPRNLGAPPRPPPRRSPTPSNTPGADGYSSTATPAPNSPVHSSTPAGGIFSSTPPRSNTPGLFSNTPPRSNTPRSGTPVIGFSHTPPRSGTPIVSVTPPRSGTPAMDGGAAPGLSPYTLGAPPSALPAYLAPPSANSSRRWATNAIYHSIL